MADNDNEYETSPLSRLFAQGDTTVEVAITRRTGSADGWTLEVIGEDEYVVEWDEPFASDQEAWDEFAALVSERGLAEVMNPPNLEGDEAPA